MTTRINLKTGNPIHVIEDQHTSMFIEILGDRLDQISVYLDKESGCATIMYIFRDYPGTTPKVETTQYEPNDGFPCLDDVLSSHELKDFLAENDVNWFSPQTLGL